MRSKKEFTTDYSGKLYKKLTDPVLTTCPSLWTNYTLNYCQNTILLPNTQKLHRGLQELHPSTPTIYTKYTLTSE